MNNQTNKAISPFATLHDNEIINKIISGEKELYELIIRRYNAFLYKTGRSYGYNHQDTQDLMQETYVSAFHKLAQFEHRSSFKTWITRILLNYCFHKKAKASFYKELLMADEIVDSTIPQFSTPAKNENSVMNKELRQVIEAALAKLPIEYRMVFSLRELSNFSVAETANTLNISENNVKVRLNRAKSMLRKEIQKTYSSADIFDFNLIYCDEVVQQVMGKITD